ncbi:peptidoglycan-binding protein [Patescibacteria group bacterium]|nr:peptidoglycan-binding protein [Patescibacteria group bacterium]
MVVGAFVILGLVSSAHAQSSDLVGAAVTTSVSDDLIQPTLTPVLSYRETLRPGARGDAVMSLQQKLKELGFYTLSVDGKYGPGTSAAVRAFQAQQGLSADGIAGINTFTAFAGGFTLPPVPTPDPGDTSVCTAIYAPVCGQVTVNCITTPCDQPEPMTYASECVAEAQGATVLYEGACVNTKPVEDEMTDEEIKTLIDQLETQIERLENYIKELKEKIARLEEQL